MRGLRGCDRIAIGFTASIQTVFITTNEFYFLADYTQYNFVRQRLSVTYGKSIFCYLKYKFFFEI